MGDGQQRRELRERRLLKLAGLILLVALILVGALLPLKYTARMHLPKQPAVAHGRDGERATPDAERTDEG